VQGQAEDLAAGAFRFREPARADGGAPGVGRLEMRGLRIVDRGGNAARVKMLHERVAAVGADDVLVKDVLRVFTDARETERCGRESSGVKLRERAAAGVLGG